MKLITKNTMPPATKHLTKPCTDCPLRRDSLRGWLGGSTAEQYARLCHTDAVVKCHVHEGSRCAGLAIYRSNTCKSQPKAHALPSDHDTVFSNIMQFTAHHQTVSLDTVIPVSEQNQEPDDATLEDSQPPQVTKSELLDSLKSLIKMHAHRDPISDKLLPSDLQPDPEIGEAMRLVVSAGGAV